MNSLHTGSPVGRDCRGTLLSQDYILIQYASGCVLMGATANTLIGWDPKLDALRDNGGPTRTHALLEGSPAIDAGHSSGFARDQRGWPRPLDNPDFPNYTGDATDIGAFEADLTVGDGLPDLWEMYYFGHIGYGPRDDYDGNGANSWNECVARTNPTNAASYLHVEYVAVAPESTDMVIGFLTVTGRTYRVEWTEDLRADWSPIPNQVNGTGNIEQIADLGAALKPKRFYRLQVLP